MTTLLRKDIVWLAFPRLLGFAFNWGLIGALSVQVYVYYMTFRNDRLFFKALVYTVFLLDWAQTISATYDASQWFAFGWGDLEALDNLYSEFLNVPILTSIIGAIVQIFFGWRIWTLSKSKAVFAFIITMALLQLAGAAAVGHYLIIKPRETNDIPGLPKAVGVRLGTSAAVDIVIASCMTFYLLRNRSEFAFQTNAVITKLVRLTVETGVITAAAAIVDLIFFLSMHNNALHQISGVNLAKLYTNSLMMLFNNRSKLQNDFGSSVEDTEIRLESTGRGGRRGLESNGTDATVFHATTVKSDYSGF
ncbi:hypothetical protein Moror_16590 [Moniliophthora roreri MCA 2997]|uniref:DUF6534 domain-containing protein n=2 Tax=Moniliophthora roreri TaxID=221103 RepID=V2Y3S9_MONRO|nr:hypothetical protein Moror_16590 [Moniliophthora roreri MCA 2997]